VLALGVHIVASEGIVSVESMLQSAESGGARDACVLKGLLVVSLAMALAWQTRFYG
jgi:hypothetical protein